MFFSNKENKDYLSVYNRIRPIHLIFVSFYNKHFSASNRMYSYVCDEEFLKKLLDLQCLANTNISNKTTNYFICLDTLPSEIPALTKFYNNDLVSVFKTYFGLADLDKLYKGDTNVIK